MLLPYQDKEEKWFVYYAVVVGVHLVAGTILYRKHFNLKLIVLKQTTLKHGKRVYY